MATIGRRTVVLPWAGLLFALVTIVGCGPAELRGLTPLYDFSARFDEARVQRVRTDIDIGSTRDGDLMLSGWSVPEMNDEGVRYTWATAREASIRLEAIRTDPAKLEFRCRPFWYEGAPDQSVAVEVNGTPIGEVVLRREWSSYDLAVPGDTLRIGENTVTLGFAYAASPQDHGGNDGRTLAAAFDSAALEWGRPISIADDVRTEGPRADVDRLMIPIGGTAAVYTVAAPKDGMLEARLEPADTSASGVLWVRPVRGPAASMQSVTISARSPRPILLPLDAEPGSLVRIGFAAIGEPAASSNPAPIIWLSPRLYGRQPDLEPVPHVVLIVVDTLRADHVGVYGSEVETPNIDRLAAAGVRFENAYSHIPITGPSHASLFSSLLPFEHGVVNNAQIFDPGEETTAEMLGGWGRRTAGFVSLGVLKRAFGFGRGFESYYDDFPRDWMKDAGEVNVEVMDWLDGISNAPFFAWIHYSDPHEPYAPPGLTYPEIKVVFDDAELSTVTAGGRGYSLPIVVPPGGHTVRFEPAATPPRHRIRFPGIRLGDDRLELNRRVGWTTKTKRFGDPAFDTRLPATLEIVNPTAETVTTDLRLICRELLSIAEIRERYALEVEYVDRRVGELMAELDRRGVLENALVIFTSDHGEAFGEHNHVGHISQLYDQLIRVPLIVSHPGRLPEGMVVDETVGLIDLYPTVAELLRLPPAPAARGQSLVPLIEGGAWSGPPVVAETYRPEAYTDKRAVVSAGFKYIHSVGDREWEELYDLKSDPGETTDLVADRPELVEKLRGVLRLRLESGIRGITANADLTEEEKEQLRALGYIR